MNPTNIHPKFSLNGFSFKKNDLKEFAYDYCKEGEQFEKDIGYFLGDWLSPNEFIKVNTSGSTGKPKSIMLKKRHMVNSAAATGYHLSLISGDSALHCLPSNFISGKMMLVRAMVLGLKLDCVAPISNPLGQNHKVYDFAAMVPLQLENSINEIERIKQLIVGGAPISRTLKASILGKTTKVYETYGMTETITHIAVRRINSKKKSASEEKDLPFKTLPEVFVKTDTRDCLVIDAPNISESAIVTNDIVNIVSDTEFEWLGRFDSVINSGGVKLIPEQIEKELASIIQKPFFVAGVPDETLGQKLVLIVEGTVDEKQLISSIRKNGKLSKFQIPKKILTCTKFSRTKNGKLSRTKTLERIRI